MDWTVARIVDRLEALASNARERQRSHQADQTAWHYEHGVGDAYAFAARMVSEFAQGGTVAQPPEVVPNSSPEAERMNAAQADYPLEAFKKEFLLDEGGNAPRTGEVAKNRLEVLFGPGAGASRFNETIEEVRAQKEEVPSEEGLNMKLSRPWLMQLRQSKFGLQRNLAEALGVSEAVVCQWESGARRPSYPKMLALAKLLGPEVMDRFAAEAQDGRVA